MASDNLTPFGPRASITRVGVAEPLPNGVWYLTGWSFDTRGDRSLVFPCPYVHDENRLHVGILGWLFSDLRALSEAEMELARLEVGSERP